MKPKSFMGQKEDSDEDCDCNGAKPNEDEDLIGDPRRYIK
jgi:hypothetical protein